MEIKMKPMVDAHELAEAVEIQYGLEEELDIANVLFSTHFHSGTIKEVDLSDRAFDGVYGAIELAETYNRMSDWRILQLEKLILFYLHDVVAPSTEVLIQF